MKTKTIILSTLAAAGALSFSSASYAWGSWTTTHTHYCNCGHTAGSSSCTSSSGGTTSSTTSTSTGGTTTSSTTSGGTTTTSTSTTSGGTTTSTSTTSGGGTTSTSSGGTAVPEPGMLGIMGMGLLGVGVARRRKQRA